MAQFLRPLLGPARRGAHAVAVALILGGHAPLPAAAEVLSAQVRVRGMMCTICSSSVERRLRRVSCVQRATVDLERGLAQLTPKGGARFDGKRVLSAIRSAGFTPGDIEVVAEGAVSEHGGLTYLELAPGELAVLRAAAASLPAGRAGARMRVKGRFSDPSGDPRAAVAIAVQQADLASAP